MGADEKFETEGRVITLEFPDYYFVTVYTPNAQRELTRLDFRCEWEDAFRAYLIGLDKKKPVIVCGDMNVAHNEIDLKNPKSNRGNAGFTDEERQKFTVLLESGFADSFRMLYPDRADAYTWWSYMFKARERNTGWRIDYFLVSARLIPSVKGCLHSPPMSWAVIIARSGCCLKRSVRVDGSEYIFYVLHPETACIRTVFRLV